jgi:hypothetical protein
MNFSYHETTRPIETQDPEKIIRQYELYKKQRLEREKEQTQIKEQKQKEKQKYSLKPVKTTTKRKCAICRRQIPKGTTVKHRTRIVTDPRNLRPRWQSEYFCNFCRPLVEA